MNFADTVLRHARGRPDHPAIEDRGRVLSYGDLPGRVRSAAGALVAAGLRPGDYVGLMVRDSTELLIAAMAVFRAGGVLVSLSPAGDAQENARLAEQLSLRFVVTEDGTADDIPADILALPTICDAGLPQDRRLPDVGGDADCVCLPSSGTTGMPKAVTWSHARVIEWGERLIKYCGWSPDDRYLVIIHMTFGYGRALGTGLLQAGGTVVVADPQPVAQFPRAIRDLRITLLYLTPTHLRYLLQHPPDHNPLLPGVRALYSASAPITTAERQRARRQLTPNLYETYGTNEAGPLTIATPADLDRHPDSVGRVIEEVEIDVVDQSGQPLPPGQIGLVRFRAANFPTSYVRNPEISARHFRKGWFYPGDLAALDSDRYLFFKGRADDVINNQGVKFYPIEVEEILLRHPAVSEAAVVGMPHAVHGEVPVAFVVAPEGTKLNDLKVGCREQLPTYKVPDKIYRCSALPKNEMGKVLKRVLKADAERYKARRSPVR